MMKQVPTTPFCRRRARQILGAALVAAAVLAALGMAFSVAYQLGRRQSEREHLQNSVALRELIVDVEAIRTRLGRVPRDEAELILLRDKPMPQVHDQGSLIPVDYLRTGEDSYRLHFESWKTDDWTFDSTKPHE